MSSSIGNDLKLPKFYENAVFLFSEEAFQFSKVHENDGKLDKHNSKGSLTVTSKFKNS